MFNIVWILLICLEKIAERFCLIKTTSKHCGKMMSTYWHQKTINGDHRSCLPVWGLCSSMFRSTCTTFVIYTYLVRYNVRPNKKICSFPVARPTLEVKLLNAFMLQLNTITIIQLLALFKLILYSNLLTIINVALYFTFDSIIFF